MINGATQVLFEGVPTHPDAGRAWDIVDKYKVRALQPLQHARLRAMLLCRRTCFHVMDSGTTHEDNIYMC